MTLNEERHALVTHPPWRGWMKKPNTIRSAACSELIRWLHLPLLKREGRLRSKQDGDLASEMQMTSTSIRRAAADELRANTTPHERILRRALKELPVDGTSFGGKRRSVPTSWICSVQPSVSSLNATAGITMTMKLPTRDGDRQLRLEQRDIASSASGIQKYRRSDGGTRNGFMWSCTARAKLRSNQLKHRRGR